MSNPTPNASPSAMSFGAARLRISEGPGVVDRKLLAHCGENVVIEEGVRIFHPTSVFLGDRTYVGHDTILKGYHRNRLHIAADVWIGQMCFFHSAGGIEIGRAVGIGPGVRILTSAHEDGDRRVPVMHHPLRYAAVVIGEGADIGTGSIVLPGVTIGIGVVVGAGSVVTTDVPDYSVVAGAPARPLRMRTVGDLR